MAGAAEGGEKEAGNGSRTPLTWSRNGLRLLLVAVAAVIAIGTAITALRLYQLQPRATLGVSAAGQTAPGLR